MSTYSRFHGSLLLGTLLFVGSVLALPVGAAAQLSTDSAPTLVEHLRSELRSTDAMRQEYALLDIIALANCTGSCTLGLYSIQDQTLRIENETGKGSLVDLNSLTPDLLANYRRGPADGHRLLALSALIRIGNERALEQLLDDDSKQSSNVEKRTQQSLAAFYMEKYPELTERAIRRGELSLEDVQRAKVVRVRQANKEQG